MQRLFSMFPEGRAGIALLFLRASVSTALVVDASTQLAAAPPHWICAVLIVVAASVLVGLMTPLVSVLACLLGLMRALDPNAVLGPLDLLATLNALSLALLGPGAYSLDARLFGRRVVSVLPGND